MIEQESSYPLQADLRFSREKIEKAVLEGGSRRYGLLFSLGSVEEKELGIFIGGDTSAALPSAHYSLVCFGSGASEDKAFFMSLKEKLKALPELLTRTPYDITGHFHDDSESSGSPNPLVTNSFRHFLDFRSFQKCNPKKPIEHGLCGNCLHGMWQEVALFAEKIQSGLSVS